MAQIYNTVTRTFEELEEPEDLELTEEEEDELWAEYDEHLEEIGQKEPVAIPTETKKDTGWTPDEAREDIMDITRRMF